MFVVLLAALMVMAMSASAAFAGEVTGSGKGGPAGDGIPGAVEHGNSNCLFSGLEDGGDYPEQPEGPGAPPQNWGHVKDVDTVVLDSPRGASQVYVDFGFGPFWHGCNPVFGDEAP
jgi:hypothetical protein